jgi:NAD/NADP transhydrogenase alpha subunit
VSKLTKPGFSVLIEKGAGSFSHFSDAEYEAAGAKVVDAEDLWKKSDIVMKVRSNTTSASFIGGTHVMIHS